MSASLHWEPVSEGRYLGVDLPSRFIESLGELAGSLPCELDGSHATALRSMAKASGEKAYLELADAVDKYDRVRVWATY